MYGHEIGREYVIAPHIQPPSIESELARGADPDILEDIGFREQGSSLQLDVVLRAANVPIPVPSVTRVIREAKPEIKTQSEIKDFDQEAFDAAFDRYADHGMDSGTARKLAYRDQGL